MSAVRPSPVGGKEMPPHESATFCEDGLHIERNVAVQLRDGARILIDISRAEESAGELPILLGWSPYGKHNTSDKLTWAAAAVAAGRISRYTVFEAPDPVYWCAHGY